MTSLNDLIKRDGIHARFFWTHEVSTGPYSEYEVWDLLVIGNTHEPQKFVTDGNTRRTAYFRGIGGAEVDSRRNNGGRHVNPELTTVLRDLLMDAAKYEEMPTLREWIMEVVEVGSTLDYDEIEAMYNGAKAAHDELRHLLMDSYEEYKAAADN